MRNTGHGNKIDSAEQKKTEGMDRLIMKSVWGHSQSKVGEVYHCYGLNVHVPQKFTLGVEILISKVMVLGGGAFERWSGHEGRGLQDRISALMKEARELPCPFYHTRTQRENGHLEARKQAFNYDKLCMALHTSERGFEHKITDPELVAWRSKPWRNSVTFLLSSPEHSLILHIHCFL